MPKMSINTWIIVCSLTAAFLAGIIATLQFIKQKMENETTIKFQNELIKKQDTIEGLQHLSGLKSDKMIKIQQEIITLQNKLNVKNEEIHALQSMTIQTIKGTDKPPVFKLANNLYNIVFIAENESSDLKAYFGCSIYDFEVLKKCKTRSVNIIDDNCVKQSLFFENNNISLKPKETVSISPAVPIPIVLGNTYKYLIYTNIDDAKYIEQVYIKASDKSINTLIRIFKFNGTDYILYSEPFKNNENIDWEKEFDLPKIMYLGKVL